MRKYWKSLVLFAAGIISGIAINIFADKYSLPKDSSWITIILFATFLVFMVPAGLLFVKEKQKTKPRSFQWLRIVIWIFFGIYLIGTVIGTIQILMKG